MNMTSRVNDQQGMTGMATVIILIAFVTVVADFGCAVMGTGGL